MSVRAPVGTLNIANQNCCIGRGLAALNLKLALLFIFGSQWRFLSNASTGRILRERPSER